MTASDGMTEASRRLVNSSGRAAYHVKQYAATGPETRFHHPKAPVRSWTAGTNRSGRGSVLALSCMLA